MLTIVNKEDEMLSRKQILGVYKKLDSSDAIGSGNFARVFPRRDPTKVMKIAPGDRGYARLLDFIEANPSQHAPVVYARHTDKDASLVVMERLEDVPDGVQNVWASLYPPGYDSHRDLVLNARNATGFNIGYVEEFLKLWTADAFDYMKTLQVEGRKSGVGTEFPIRNCMVRNTAMGPVLVFVDPWFAGSSRSSALAGLHSGSLEYSSFDSRGEAVRRGVPVVSTLGKAGIAKCRHMARCPTGLACCNCPHDEKNDTAQAVAKLRGLIVQQKSKARIQLGPFGVAANYCGFSDAHTVYVRWCGSGKVPCAFQGSGYWFACDNCRFDARAKVPKAAGSTQTWLMARDLGIDTAKLRAIAAKSFCNRY
jgi:hypothetical protein